LSGWVMLCPIMGSVCVGPLVRAPGCVGTGCAQPPLDPASSSTHQSGKNISHAFPTERPALGSARGHTPSPDRGLSAIVRAVHIPRLSCPARRLARERACEGIARKGAFADIVRLRDGPPLSRGRRILKQNQINPSFPRKRRESGNPYGLKAPPSSTSISSHTRKRASRASNATTRARVVQHFSK